MIASYEKLLKLIFTLIVGTFIYFLLGERIPIIKKKDSKIEKILASFYYSTQVTTTLGLLDTIDDLLIGVIVSIHAIIVLILGVIE
tara:strand:- start:686 stop:943 length:258 start_codon:yes stop_codon:yes gene_type:complete